MNKKYCLIKKGSLSKNRGLTHEPTPNRKGVKKTKIKDVFYEYEKMLFLFDYGDMWQFIVVREKIEEASPHQKYPFILEKIGKPPLQYPPLEEDFYFEDIRN